MAGKTRRVVVPFRVSSTGHFVVEGKINGHAVRLVVDTAAGRSVIDAGEVERLELRRRRGGRGGGVRGLGTSDHAMERLLPPVLRLGTLVVRDVPFLALDLGHVKAAGGRGGMHGLLGSDFLLRYGAILHAEKRRLSLRTKPLAGAAR